MKPRTHVDLFSGIGGFSLACQWAGVETIAFAETDSYASRVLQRHWPGVKNYGDVRGFPSMSGWLLTAGVPCQPASVAGKRKGAADDRWLWPETLAVVENGSYEWLLFENPIGILSLNDGLEFERICAALESKGYEVQPFVIPACGVGAWHRRYRVWIAAHSKSKRARIVSMRSGRQEQEAPDVNGCGQVAGATSNSECARLPSGLFGFAKPRAEVAASGYSATAGIDQWQAWDGIIDQSWLGDGLPPGLAEVHSRLWGNAIVPQVAYQLIKRMIEAEETI